MPPSKKILVIDDDPNLQKTICLILQGAGYEVTVALDAQHGLQALQAQPYDLVIQDHRLPDMNGLTLVPVIHNMYPNMPVLILTGYGSADVEREAGNKSVQGYLVKPVDPKVILTKIQAIFQTPPGQQSDAGWTPV